MISGLTLLRAEEAPEARDHWSYVRMAVELRRVVAEAKKDASELFRRMVFNALISNTDDHPRNHAVIAKEREWKLSPAYDLTPSPVIAQDHRDLAMEIGDQGRFANAKNLLSQHACFLLEKQEAKAVVSDMTEKVRATWYDVVRARAFEYQGPAGSRWRAFSPAPDCWPTLGLVRPHSQHRPGQKLVPSDGGDDA